MPKNIVICSDGTGNTFSEHVSNITHLLKVLELGCPAKQLVFYDQGLGTNPKLVARIRAYRHERNAKRDGLIVLAQPGYHWLMAGIVGRVAGLLFGYGLRANVKEMYRALVEHYEEGDRIFLFGFSRSAFTVRVLAGLLYRCGLLQNNPRSFQRPFAKAYELFKPHWADDRAVERFRNAHHVRNCKVHFLGIFDTVKSYGGVWPKSLPHLRHNPSVKTVRHALALNEHRSWFIPTSWGGIDTDEKSALGLEADDGYASQDVQEVWFCGCHSDVGGGDQEAETAATPLRWMLSEAVAQCIVVNEHAHALLAERNRAGMPVIHESLTFGWLLSEYLPRWELDNDFRPPKRYFKLGRSGKRNALQFKRAGKVLLHWSAQAAYPVEAEYVDAPCGDSERSP